MRKRLTNLTSLSVFFILLANAAQAAIIGPVYPAPGGNNWSQVSGTSAGDAGGVLWQYSGFNGLAFDELYWGASVANAIQAGLDGNLHVLTFLDYDLSDYDAHWYGNVPYNYFNQYYDDVQIRFTMTLIPLSASQHLELASWDSSLGAVADNSSGGNYQARLQFEAFWDGQFRPLNEMWQSPSHDGYTMTSFNGGFYYQQNTVPEPSFILLLVSGLIGVCGLKRKWTNK
jgi:hypothetical protein